MLQIDRICNETTHQKAPPTKHNWICTGRSVGEVISKNEDFIKYYKYLYSEIIVNWA